MAHYRSAQPSPPARAASAALPGYIVGATDWLRSIWRDRAAFVDKPALILSGLKDIAFRRKELERWKSALQDVEIHEFEDCGHFSGGRGAGQGRGGGSELDGALVAPLLRQRHVVRPPVLHDRRLPRRRHRRPFGDCRNAKAYLKQATCAATSAPSASAAPFPTMSSRRRREIPSKLRGRSICARRLMGAGGWGWRQGGSSSR